MAGGSNANKSGVRGEKKVQSLLEARNIPFERQPKYNKGYGPQQGKSDFKLTLADGVTARVEVKMQNVQGSVSEKAFHVLFNAYNIFNEDEVWFCMFGDQWAKGIKEYIEKLSNPVEWSKKNGFTTPPAHWENKVIRIFKSEQQLKEHLETIA